MEQFRAWLAKNSQTELAEALGITQGAVSQWLTNGIPLERVRPVERITGIPAAILRPDVFGPQATPKRRSRENRATA